MCVLYHLKFEDASLKPIDDYVFDSKADAMAAFADVIDDPDPDLGSVYMLEECGNDDVVIAGHYFVDTATV